MDMPRHICSRNEVGVDINVRVCQSGQSLHVGNCIKPTKRTDCQTGHSLSLPPTPPSSLAACDSNNFKMFEKQKAKVLQADEACVVTNCSCSMVVEKGI